MIVFSILTAMTVSPVLTGMTVLAPLGSAHYKRTTKLEKGASVDLLTGCQRDRTAAEPRPCAALVAAPRHLFATACCFHTIHAAHTKDAISIATPKRCTA